MTHDELMALPDVTPSLGEKIVWCDGGRMVIPVQQGFAGALFTDVDDGVFRDGQGDYWLVGRLDGKRVRRKFL